MNNQQGWRVKLYQLNEQGQWDDRGTGHICCTYVENLGNSLVILSEDNQQELMKSKILDEDVYQRQGDNIITWCEPNEENNAGTDLALSFQENAGCLEIWNKICDVQGKFSDFRADDSKYSLPECKLDNLAEVGEVLAGATQQQQKEVYCNLLLANDGEYMTKLLKLFSDCEDLDDIENLHIIVNIFKAIFSLNDPTLLEVILSDQFFIPVAGVFEYDPELRQRGEHRKFLAEKVNFKQVIPIEDPELKAKIHQNFRITFLKDVLLRPMMDDAYVSTLNSLTFFNNSEIIQALHQDSDYLKRLFNLFLAKDTSKESKSDVLAFLREMFSMSKTLQPSVREQFYRYVQNECPFYDIFVMVLADGTSTVPERMCCMEVMSASLFHDPSLLRNYVLQKGSHPPMPPYFGSASQVVRKEEKKPESPGHCAVAGESKSLLYWVIRRLVSDKDSGVLLQAADVMRECLNCETMEGSDRDNFLTVFYDHYIHWLVEPFWLNNAGDGTTEDVASKISKWHVCDLLSFCVRSHTYRMKYFVLRNNIVSRVLKLLQYKDKYLKLAAVRFIRACVGIKDDFYNRYLVKNNLLMPVINLFQDQKQMDNLINSSIIEMVEFIRAENIKILIENLVERYRDNFKDVEYVTVFKDLQLKYDQNKEYSDNKGKLQQDDNKSNATNNKRRKYLEDQKEESYFDESDEDEPKKPQPSGGAPQEDGDGFKLVDYDEDSDDESRPPPLKRKPDDDDDDLLATLKRQEMADRQNTSTTAAPVKINIKKPTLYADEVDQPDMKKQKL
mmetsp:Transcript_31052/g.41037  ORF Transcript_31052/g.41037 Transcript_31052/m.41037 type:complete len:785 (-) Transcript_31052:262-2616(-)|eukprot:CAMPEP_0117755808 /NCGR_PEP_ID=MMETSP0947-20121206/13671_1 /TAXON_ID=44440 /ORGANISM="Chattonella subsalsa, Strain CCMP2191" /LENGTH=784 /DNA_ID=CAMNT_0005575211 /DNA_START=217 /DNA_END=2571 /DNA_ORIENTATION=-